MLIKTSNVIVLAAIVSLFAALGLTRAIAASNLVEIFYLPHPPAEAVVRDVEAVLKKYSQFKVEKYSFEDPKSRKLLSKYNIREHMPVVIFVNGKSEFVIGNKKVIFKNFPKGNAFVPTFEGNWSYQDFESILMAIVRGK
jgi:hypothetical protein